MDGEESRPFGVHTVEGIPKSKVTSYLVDNMTKPENDSPVAIRRCDYIDTSYDIYLSIICCFCFVFGILYTFFGYRYFKATMFLTGFIFGSVLVFMICTEEEALEMEANVGLAIGAGLLCGLITMLVQYTGIFLTGFNFGLSLGIFILVIIEQFYHPTTKWIPIGVLCGLGVTFALLNLKFQISLTILGTSMFGSGLMVAFIDYFIEKFMMIHYVWDRVKGDESGPVCLYSWVILGCWPFAFMVGAIAQWKITSRGVDHREALQFKRVRNLNLQKLRTKQKKDDQHARYRHLYKARRVTGDIIAQNYAESAPTTSSSPSVRGLTALQNEGGTLQEVDSANTTLTHIT